MSAALTPPFAVACLVLCIAGLAKLRSPAAAVQALSVIGPGGSATLIRITAAGELALGAWSISRPSALTASAVGTFYVAFAGLSLLLARKRAACGCFGQDAAPASGWQSVLSLILAAMAFAAAARAPYGIGWVVARGPADALVLVAGIATSAYAVVLAYTQLPRAWTAWGMR